MKTPSIPVGGPGRRSPKKRSLYVIIVPGTKIFKHWRGYRDYDRAFAIAENAEAIVSSAQWLRRRFYPTPATAFPTAA